MYIELYVHLIMQINKRHKKLLIYFIYYIYILFYILYFTNLCD